MEWMWAQILDRNKLSFFRPSSNPARPAKCSGLVGAPTRASRSSNKLRITTAAMLDLRKFCGWVTLHHNLFLHACVRPRAGGSEPCARTPTRAGRSSIELRITAVARKPKPSSVYHVEFAEIFWLSYLPPESLSSFIHIFYTIVLTSLLNYNNTLTVHNKIYRPRKAKITYNLEWREQIPPPIHIERCKSHRY